MHRFTRIAAGTAFAGSLLFTGAVAPASAAPVIQDGLVNVTIGDITVTDTVDVAASAAITACDLVDVSGTQVAVLARATNVDRSGNEQTICRTDAGDVTLTNN